MRGNARNLTPEGVCGHQKLFVTAEFKRFYKHREALFPRATFVVEKVQRHQKGGAEALVWFLASETERCVITAKQVLGETGVNLGKHKKRLLDNPLVTEAMASGGWVYVPGGGRGNTSRFERTEAPRTTVRRPELAVA